MKSLLHQAGILAFSLPPYSPDLNPIEEAFNYVKSCLRKHDVLLQSGAPLTSVVEAVFQMPGSQTQDTHSNLIIL